MRLNHDVTSFRRQRLVLLGVLLVVMLAPQIPSTPASAARLPLQDVPLGVTAAGRIEPKDGVITIAAPASAETGPAIVTDLLVQEGDDVVAGQPLALLRGRAEAEARLAAARRTEALAAARLAAVRAGVKPDELAALQADVRSGEADLELARADLDRTRRLQDAGMVSTANGQAQASKVEIAQQALAATRARLRALGTVRPADIAVADAELQAAAAGVREMAVRLEATVVRAPVDGRVLALHARAGQMVGIEGLLLLGQMTTLYATADVDEADLPRVQVGQWATVTGSALAGPLTGRVESIGRLVVARTSHGRDPTAFNDARVVQVRVRLQDAPGVAPLVNARVDVRLEPAEARVDARLQP